MDISQFLKKLKNDYPELTEKLNKQEGLLNMEVSVFIDFIQNLINDGEREKFKKCIELANQFYSNGNKSLQECIRNGVCEDLNFDDSKKSNRSWATEYVPPELKKELKLWYEFMGKKYHW